MNTEDMGNFPVPADQRDLNYDKYFVEGNICLSTSNEYNSHNTQRLIVDEIKSKLYELNYIQEELKSWISIPRLSLEESKTRQLAQEMMEQELSKRRA